MKLNGVFSENYIELASLTEELPLDEATIAVIVDNGKDAVVVASYPLTNQRIRPDFMFTIGAILGADVLDYLRLPVSLSQTFESCLCYEGTYLRSLNQL